MTGPVKSAANIEIRPTPNSSGRASIPIEVSRRLRRSGYLALRDVTCEVDGESLHLQGRLPTHYLKQLAQAIVAQVEGIRFIVNLIEVTDQIRRSGSGRELSTRTNNSISVHTIPHRERG
jgi:hypothetical protein